MLFNNGAAMAQIPNFGRRTVPQVHSVPCSPLKAGNQGTGTEYQGSGTGYPVHSNGAQNGARNGAPFDAQTVIARLEEAGRTILAMPNAGWTTKLRTSHVEFIRSTVEAYGWEPARVRPAHPDAAHITRMDDAFAWLIRIPRDRYVLRRIVAARSLVSPVTDRHLFPWRRLAATVGADHKAIQRWHAQGIDLIVRSLNDSRRPATPR